MKRIPMMNTNQTCTDKNCINYEYDDGVLERLALKQQYLDYCDADMEAFYAIKADTLGFDVTGL